MSHASAVPENTISNTRLRLGIDVGGTNTDAVLMDDGKIISAIKRPTTIDVGKGVVDAVTALLEDADCLPQDVHRVMIGTTQFVNAFVQRKNLSRTAIIRIAAPKSDGVPPLVAWPDELSDAIGAFSRIIEGGAFYTGEEYIPLNEAELNKIIDELISEKIETIAVSSVFSPIQPEIETRAATIIADRMPTAFVTRSSDIGGIGLIDRENAAIVNASLVPFANRIVRSMNSAFESLGFSAKPLFTQNDGTLITGEKVQDFPVFTCAAGPTNSIRGAGFLTNSQEAVVIDVGGTTTDIGFLNKGFPRETSSANYIGGVRTNFRMPDILSIALGGGTIVSPNSEGIELGPESVGFRLQTEAMVFGGSIMTATDIAVAAGYAKLGEPGSVAHLSSKIISQSLAAMQNKLDVAIEQMRTSAKRTDAILVGGGSILFQDELPGGQKLIRPDFADVANAIGAAISQVSGRIDKLYDFADGREPAIELAKNDAIEKAIASGADPETIEIIDVEELPLTHMQSTKVRVRVNAVGDLL